MLPLLTPEESGATAHAASFAAQDASSSACYQSASKDGPVIVNEFP
jgi:hypothetical protein